MVEQSVAIQERRRASFAIAAAQGASLLQKGEPSRPRREEDKLQLAWMQRGRKRRPRVSRADEPRLQPLRQYDTSHMAYDKLKGLGERRSSHRVFTHEGGWVPAVCIAGDEQASGDAENGTLWSQKWQQR